MTPTIIINHFLKSEKIRSIEPYGSGHINDTYLVSTTAKGVDYIFQKINKNIFKDIHGMMMNIEIVTRHLKKKLAGLPGHDPVKETLNLVRTKAGDLSCEDEKGNAWRLFIFIPGTKTYEMAPDSEIAREAGRIIGLFHHLLTDLEKPVKDTLPGFHSIRRREGEFRAALVADPENRLIACKQDILFVEDRLESMRHYFDAFEKRGLPKRVVHYDTKLNNILFDEKDRALCLIDLDTLCPGYVHFDYGDSLRTLANTAAEDEKDTGNVNFNRDYYHAFTEGYLSEAGEFLSEEEKKMLPFAPIYLTFLIGLRFLTDYLNGDTYYKINYPEHNLVRARVQFKLVTEMEKTA